MEQYISQPVKKPLVNKPIFFIMGVSESTFLFPPTTQHYLLYGGNEEMK